MSKTIQVSNSETEYALVPDRLAALQHKQAGLPGWIQDAAENGDVPALIGLRAQADALPDLIDAERVKLAALEVERAEAAVPVAEAEAAEARANFNAADGRYREAKEERDQLALVDHNAKYRPGAAR